MDMAASIPLTPSPQFLCDGTVFDNLAAGVGFCFYAPFPLSAGPPLGSNECLSRKTDQREDVNIVKLPKGLEHMDCLSIAIAFI
jgi:hypothetical protein